MAENPSELDDLTAVEPFNGLLSRFPRHNLQVLVHFYRGELSRANVWRQKMDMTTNWAIVSSTAIISVAFSQASITHLLIPFGSLIVYLLLNIEGRRYRYYDLWRTRIRMLEVHFIVPAIIHDKPLPEGNWREVLCEDLFTPSYKISYWEALGRRLHRTYIYIFAILVLAWIAKVYVHNYHGQFGLFSAFEVKKDDVLLLPAWLVVSLMGAFHVFLAGVLLVTRNWRRATGEIRRKDPRRKTWPV